MPSIGKIAEEEFNETKDKHYSSLDDSFEYNKADLAHYLGIKDIPNLSIYGSTSRLFNTYSRALEVLKTTSLDEFKKFAENDQKIKESFARAKKLFKNDDLYADIERVENEYLTMLEESTSSYVTFRNSGIIKLQNHMLETASELDEKSDKREKYNSYKEYLYSLTFSNIDFDKLLETQKYVNENDVLEEEFYNVLYSIVEKEKYGCIKYNQTSELLDKLSEETLFKLETKYVDRISLLSEEEIPEALREYKEKGYLHSMDKALLKVFEEDGIKNKPYIIFHIKEKEKEEKKGKLSDKTLRIIGDRICENYPRDRRLEKYFDSNLPIQVDEQLFKAELPTKNGKEYYYFDEAGERVETIASNVNITFRTGNFYIGSDSPLTIYDKALEHILFKADYEAEDESLELTKDEANKVILICAKNAEDQFLFKFDYDGHLLGSYKLSEIAKIVGKNKKMSFIEPEAFIDHYKDDVIGVQLRIKDKNDAYYKCLYNLKKESDIIHFDGENKVNGSSLFNAFSNGRLDFYIEEDSSKIGFIDTNGDRVIPAQYSKVSDFAGGMSYVKDQDGVHHLIDIWGENIDTDIDLENENYSYEPDKENDRYIIRKPNGEYWSMRTGTKIQIDSKRHLINYLKPKQKEKVKQLKKDAS